MSSTPVVKNLFFSTFPSCSYVFRNGKPAHFIGGKYSTAIESEIKELEEEIAAGHPHLYINEQQRTISAADEDPIEQIKKKAIAEYLAAQKTAVNPEADRGNTDAGLGARLKNIQAASQLNTAAESITKS